MAHAEEEQAGTGLRVLKGSRTPSSFSMIGCVRLKFLKCAIGGSSEWHCLQPRGL
jgi:hypothetical protein